MSLGQEIPLHAWTELVTDIFHFEGASYLLTVDYTSRFPVGHKLSSMTGQHVATQCKFYQNMIGQKLQFLTMAHAMQQKLLLI